MVLGLDVNGTGLLSYTQRNLLILSPPFTVKLQLVSAVAAGCVWGHLSAPETWRQESGIVWGRGSDVDELIFTAGLPVFCVSFQRLNESGRFVPLYNVSFVDHRRCLNFRIRRAERSGRVVIHWLLIKWNWIIVNAVNVSINNIYIDSSQFSGVQEPPPRQRAICYFLLSFEVSLELCWVYAMIWKPLEEYFSALLSISQHREE